MAKASIDKIQEKISAAKEKYAQEIKQLEKEYKERTKITKTRIGSIISTAIINLLEKGETEYSLESIISSSKKTDADFLRNNIEIFNITISNNAEKK